MPHTFPAALVLALVTMAASAQAPQSPAPAAADAPQPAPFEAAQDLAAKGRLDKALALLDQLATQTPEQPGVERLRGIIFYQRDQFHQAIDAFTQAAQQDPADRESIEMHGVVSSAWATPPRPSPSSRRRTRPWSAPTSIPNTCLASVTPTSSATTTPVTPSPPSTAFAPDSAEAYLLAGRLFLRREFAAEAAVQASRALEINPNLPLAHQLLGEVALAKGDMPAAIRELEQERKLNPLNGLLYERLGDAYLRNEQYSDAQQALNRAVLLEPSSTAPYILLGETFLKLNQPIQAIHYLDHAAKMDPSNYITHNFLGQAYKATGQTAEANREFKLVVDLQHGAKAQPTGK